MYQGHPFRTGVRTLLESKPAALRAPVVGVAIAIDRKNPRGKPKPTEIESVLDGVRDPAAVRLLEIDPLCSIDRVPSAVARWSELEYAHVAGRRLRDYSALAELVKIRSLFVMGYKAPSIWPLPAALECFRSIGDSLETCALSAGELWLQRSKLRRFNGGAVRRVRLESCGRLDLSSLAALTGVEELSLMNHPELPSLDFLAACPTLHTLSIHSRLRDTNIDELSRSQTLARITIQLPAKLIEKVGRANPRLAITNGEACFVGGKPARHFGDFYP